MSELTPQEVAKWFRDQSKRFSQMADEVERSFGLKQATVSPRITETIAPSLPKLGAVTLPEIREKLKHKSARPGELARHFNVDEAAITDLIHQPGSGIKMIERGWLKLEEAA